MRIQVHREIQPSWANTQIRSSEPPLVCRRPRSKDTGSWERLRTEHVIQRNCAPERCGWSWITRKNTRADRRQSCRSLRRLDAVGTACASGSSSMRRIRVRDRARLWKHELRLARPTVENIDGFPFGALAHSDRFQNQIQTRTLSLRTRAPGGAGRAPSRYLFRSATAWIVGVCAVRCVSRLCFSSNFWQKCQPASSATIPGRPFLRRWRVGFDGDATRGSRIFVP